MQPVPIYPVGFVRTAFARPEDVPAGGGPGSVVIDPSLTEGLEGIEQASHVIVLAWLPDANRLIVRPLRRGSDRIYANGVFASRHPSRPNPISLTIAPVVGRAGNELDLDHLDLLDGTPVLDVRPYVPDLDAAFAAQSPAADAVGLLPLARLQRVLERHLGRDALRPQAQLALAAVAQAALHLGVGLRDRELRVAVNRADATLDALMALTGANFASHRVRILPGTGPLVFRFVARGRGLELGVPAKSGESAPQLLVVRQLDVDEFDAA